MGKWSLITIRRKQEGETGENSPRKDKRTEVKINATKGGGTTEPGRNSSWMGVDLAFEERKGDLGILRRAKGGGGECKEKTPPERMGGRREKGGLETQKQSIRPKKLCREIVRKKGLQKGNRSRGQKL